MSFASIEIKILIKILILVIFAYIYFRFLVFVFCFRICFFTFIAFALKLSVSTTTCHDIYTLSMNFFAMSIGWEIWDSRFETKLEEKKEIMLRACLKNLDWNFILLARIHIEINENLTHISIFDIRSSCKYLLFNREWFENSKFSIVVSRTYEFKFNTYFKIQLISTSKKNTKELSFAKARIENEKQNKTKSEKVVETTKRDSNSKKTSRKIYVQTLQE